MYTFFANPSAFETLRAGHPAIWENGHLHEQACRWLNEQVVPRSGSIRTWENKARALITWFEWCEAIKIDWRDTAADDLAAYRDAYLSAVSPLTGRPYSPGTVGTRMSAILDFFNFAHEQGWMVDASLSTEQRTAGRAPISRDMLAHTRKGGAAARMRSIIPRNQTDKVRVLSRNQLDALLKWAGPRVSERTPESGGSARDRIAIDLGWAVGLRVREKVSLTIFPFLAMTPDPASLAHHKLAVTGKGNKTRQVDVPAWLVVDIQAYIDGARAKALRTRGRGAREGQLLLNSETSTNRAGRPMKIPGVTEMMKRACAGAGLIEQRARTDPITGHAVVKAAAKFSDHSLRHTYAVMTWYALLAAGHDEAYAWKYVQHQLGHSQLATTTDTYLKHVSVWATPGLTAVIKSVR
ncbi:tyrosine-type recombinase/integrase [Leisingera sp. JC1]|uniref:tyrosine-type recombinase/integrase n=1 Tax=Leisingera sp. JC1 TaxID=1855282 RepID=UPI00113092A3|nr:tyrosine-type recombinase/integrase [Leisingera sp. JC1]